MTDKNQYGTDIAADLHAYEDQIDRAIAAGAQLAARMTLGRIEHGISAVVGQDAMARVLASAQHLGAAREDLVAAHKGLAQDARRMQIQWTSFGPSLKPEEDQPRPTGQIRRVA